ncbi:MAG TPA: triose-phosphate isomerase [Candidatus Tyrphobacter sp.]|nr:triose-phosphate isomerase [Candidatus Tyrphobacter sp.]
MSKRKKLVIANWKCNPAALDESAELARSIEKATANLNSESVSVVIAPPFPFLETVGKEINRVGLGAQNLFWEDGGAYTGETSASQLKSLGVSYVLIGHSERRRFLSETDDSINRKVLLASRAGLGIVLCVGESLKTRNGGLQEVKIFIENQLKLDLAGLPIGQKLVIAYEPIWAIGTGRSDKPEDTAEVAKYVKEIISVMGFPDARILYGGSVKPENASLFFNLTEIDGALVGGASLAGDIFGEILRLASESD